ncbi:radical SAM protein [Candidatus Saccharibacteria bacterium]|nr:radical SAM protein [Candidatus Saccharibacteria bacterium]
MRLANEYAYTEFSDGDRLRQLEAETPIHIEMDDTIRAKLTDHCGMTCTFCHNEGTPVASRLGSQALRVSIYEDTNGASFTPGQMKPNDSFRDVLVALRDGVDTHELHWTGGEPTLSPDIVEMTRIASEEVGLRVKMTSNGELGARKIKDLARAGLTGINFSIFGTTSAELAKVQAMAQTNEIWAQRKLDRLREALYEAEACGLSVGANLVVASPNDEDRILNIIDTCPQSTRIRLQADLDNQQVAWESIYDILAALDAEPVKTVASAGTSSIKVTYKLPSDRTIEFKRFMDVKLTDSCASCRYNNPTDCKEGFYGLRLYVDDKDNYKVGICLRRMDLAVDSDAFFSGSLPQEILDLRASQYRTLAQKGADILHERLA